MANTISVSQTLPAPTSNIKVIVGSIIGVCQTLPQPASNITVLVAASIGVQQTLAFGPIAIRLSNRTAQSLNINFPMINAPFVDPNTGVINVEWHRLLLTLWNRTGGAQGVNSPHT